MSRRIEPPPEKPKDLRGFFRVINGMNGEAVEAARFSDGRVVVLIPAGQQFSVYPHASMTDAQRVHAGCTWERVK